MRNRKMIFYLTMAAMGTAMLLPGNYAAAKEVDEKAGEEIIVQSLIGAKQIAGLTISGKVAEVRVYASGQNDVKKIGITVKLQKNENGKWKDVQSWEKATEALSLNFAKTYSLSSKGNYRVQATVTYYQKDNSKEIKTVTSSTKTYF
ncbi:hypothetical protein D7V86_07335 [bacterium D16-51]|nr:hypothetical protein D7V96_10290 [bacterium D16-59]RKI60890.1 hypothetical protein D7V86_07335 [bacterium D16-51]